ncbi:metallophosphoesterase [Actinospica durhamensis]|uniref:Metallophosphoesterase n=1 Tax=Actinospica durhamensis TaxID=1508375 RepID=A0A941IRV3_9ACTN|nr:metallophosphoesterase [Actinospica durhamensis]
MFGGSGSCEHTSAAKGADRRSFLRNAGLAGAGAVALGPLTAGAASASTAPASAAASASRGRWNPDTESLRFTLAVMPDTQFLYWGSQGSVNPDPQAASFRYVIENSGTASDDNIVFLAHLGDLTEDGDPVSFKYVGQTYDILDEAGVAYSVLAGNHDVSGDDTRGTTPYLQTMGPQRYSKSPTFLSADSSGYNTAHVFRAAGREWLLLALDWRTSTAGFDWANAVIKAHPTLPVILTTHEIAGTPYDDNVYPYQAGDPEDNASLSSYGQTVWDNIIKDNDQVFLTLNGHYWPPGRTTMQNAAGHDVYVHITNYQNRYFGGGGMLRLYHFDLSRDTIDVETISPWILAQKPEERNVLAAQDAELTSAVDYFSIPMNFDERFASFAPVPSRPSRPAKRMLVPGTLAYWRFDTGQADGSAVAAGTTIKDQSGHGNDLSTLVTVPGSAADALTWSTQHHPDQPGHGSLSFAGGQNPLHGAYFTTGANAPLNTETFTKGYTIELFFNIPLDWDASNNSWMSALSRWGEASQAGKTGENTDPDEPVATLSFSGDREPQWNCYPTNATFPSTNWGQTLFEDEWWHVAIVNDGKHTVMYLQGCPTVDNPTLRESIGITTLGLPWALGGYEYNGSINQIFHGFIGDVRIVNRALSVDEFMIAT